mmetsp:Transcript_5469/g.10450  ORF Transcript_5469/g.10450 Transcript_5469/m.10450 type:complete len:368 (-) Transcript_5469:1202-2305(-)
MAIRVALGWRLRSVRPRAQRARCRLPGSMGRWARTGGGSPHAAPLRSCARRQHDAPRAAGCGGVRGGVAGGGSRRSECGAAAGGAVCQRMVSACQGPQGLRRGVGSAGVVASAASTWRSAASPRGIAPSLAPGGLGRGGPRGGSRSVCSRGGRHPRGAAQPCGGAALCILHRASAIGRGGGDRKGRVAACAPPVALGDEEQCARRPMARGVHRRADSAAAAHQERPAAQLGALPHAAPPGGGACRVALGRRVRGGVSGHADSARQVGITSRGAQRPLGVTRSARPARQLPSGCHCRGCACCATLPFRGACDGRQACAGGGGRGLGGLAGGAVPAGPATWHGATSPGPGSVGSASCRPCSVRRRGARR